MATPLEGSARSNEGFAQRFGSASRRLANRHVGPSAWQRYEPASSAKSSAVMLPEGWSLTSSTDDWDTYSRDAASRYDESLRSQHAGPSASEQSSVHGSDASIRSSSTSRPAKSFFPPFSSQNTRAGPSSSPPSTISSWRGRRFGKAPRPPSSIADSVFSENTASEAGTGITIPSPVSSSIDLGHRSKWQANPRLARASSIKVTPSTDKTRSSAGDFDITIPSQRLEHSAALQPSGWTHETIGGEQLGGDESQWATRQGEGSQHGHDQGSYIRNHSSSIDGHDGPLAWRVQSQAGAKDVRLAQDMPQIRKSQSAHGHLSGRVPLQVLTPRASVDRPALHSHSEHGTPESQRSTSSQAQGLVSGLRRKLRAARPSTDHAREPTRTLSNGNDVSPGVVGKIRRSSDHKSATYSFDGIRNYVGIERKPKAQVLTQQEELLVKDFSLLKEKRKEKSPRKSMSFARPQLSSISPSATASGSRNDTSENFFDRLRRRQAKQPSHKVARDTATPSTKSESSASSRLEMRQEESDDRRAVQPSSLLLSSLSPKKAQRSTSDFTLPQTVSVDSVADVRLQNSKSNAELATLEQSLESSTPQRPLRAEPLSASERRASAQVSRHDVESSVEHKYNAAHDRRWSQSGAHYRPPSQLKEKSPEVVEVDPDAANPHFEEMESADSHGGLQAFIRRPLQSWLSSKRKTSESVSKTSEATSSNASDGDNAATLQEAPRRFSMSYLGRPRAASALGHTPTMTPAQSGPSILRRGSLRFLSNRPGSQSANGYRGSRWGGRGQSIDLSSISRPRLIANPDKPLPPLPSDFNSDQQYGEMTFYDNPPMSSAIPHRNSISEAPARTYSILADTSIAAPLLEQDEQEQIPSDETNRARAQTSPSYALGSRPTRSFSDLYSYDRGAENQQRLRQWIRPASVGHPLLSTAPVTLSSTHWRRPKFGLDLQPDAAAAFDSIPLPDSTERRRSSVRTEEMAASNDVSEYLSHGIDAPSEFDVPGDVSVSSHSDSGSDIIESPPGALEHHQRVPEEAEEEFSDALDGSSDSMSDTTDPLPKMPQKQHSDSSRSGEVEMLVDDIVTRPGNLAQGGSTGNIEAGDTLERLRTVGSTSSLVTATEFGSTMTHIPESPQTNSNLALRQL